MKRATRTPAGSRGGAALPVVLTVAGVLLLLAGVVHGHLLTSQRLAANQQRAAIAAEAADAGIDWMLGRLNAGTPVDAACRPDTGSTGPAFRETFAGAPTDDGVWNPSPHPAACTIREAGWACRCPTSGATPADTDPSPHAAFSVRLDADIPGDVMRLTAIGCSGWAPDCGGPDGARADARARAAISVGHLPALAHPPAAALTVHGRLDLGDAPWSVAAGVRPGTLAVRTGGPVNARHLGVQGPPGTPRSALVSAADPSLRTAEPASAFARQFHMDPAAWRALPAVREVACGTPCDTALLALLGPRVHHPMLWLAGGLHLAAPATLGTPERPVLLVVDGPVHLAAAVQVHGLVWARSPRWDAPGPAEVTGAVVAEGDLSGRGDTRVRHDPATLQALHHRTGTFVRVPGSWRDFE
jgi:hypothetical protein